MLSHYKFRQHLLNKGKEYGCEVIIITEEYTSKTCTYCGEISDEYDGRTKICSICNKTINRDINGSKYFVKIFNGTLLWFSREEISRKIRPEGRCFLPAEENISRYSYLLCFVMF